MKPLNIKNFQELLKWVRNICCAGLPLSGIALCVYYFSGESRWTWGWRVFSTGWGMTFGMWFALLAIAAAYLIYEVYRALYRKEPPT